MLRVRTLGGLSVQGAGRAPAATGIQPRRLAVLALVARAGDRGVTREKLLALLWPDAEVEAGRRALSQSLYALRRDLNAEELFTGVQELRLNPETATCDVLEFETAAAERVLERAAEVYSGPFLDGFRLPGAAEFDRWADEERRSLAQRHIELLERLARRIAERGDPAAASVWWRKLAELDPLNARIAVELMRALVAAGNPGGALKHARIYEALLAQELDLEPDHQVIELAQRIRNEAAAITVKPAAQPAAQPHESSENGAATAEPPDTATATAEADPVPTAPVVTSPPLASSAPPTARVVPDPVAMPEVAGDEPPRRTIVSLPRSMLRHRVAAIAAAGVAVALLASALAWWSGWTGRRTGATPVLAVGRIVDYRATDGRDADAVSDMLATNLARVQGLQVLSSARLYEVMGQIDDPRQSRNAVARAAQRAGANELLEGGLHALAGGRLLFDLRRVNLETGAVMTAHRLEGTDVYALVTQATDELARSLDHPSGRLDPADVSTRSLVAYRFYEEGLRSYARGDYRTAERLLDAALVEDSSFAMAAFYLLQTRNVRGTPNPPDAWERLIRLADRAPDRERLLIRGTWALSFGLPELEAIADTLASRYPAEVDGPYLQGYARLQNADFAAAIPYMERVLAIDSLGLRGDSPRCRACDAIGQLMYAYHSIDSLAAAERLARDWVRRQPRSARALATLAGTLVPLNRYDEAIETQRAATSINPLDVYDRVFPAVVRIRSGEFEEADRITRAVARDATGADASEGLWTLIISLRYQARWREALAVIREGLGSLPPAARVGEQGRLLEVAKALILLESGQPRQAAAVWDSLARHAPQTVPPDSRTVRQRTFQFTLLAMALSAAGDTSRLAAAVDSVTTWSARSRNRRDAGLADYSRGLLLAARADTAKAIEALGQAIYSPTTGFTRTNRDLAVLLLARGRPADAARLLGAALRGGSLESGNLYVTHTELHELLARAYDQLGKADSAAVHYRYVVAALAKSDPQARPRYEAAAGRLAALGARRQ